eukprot:354635-Chlamydomonas_euryale.AAC.14
MGPSVPTPAHGLGPHPLRVLRAVRFGTRFGFELEQSLVEAASSEQVGAHRQPRTHAHASLTHTFPKVFPPRGCQMQHAVESVVEAALSKQASA